MTAFLGGNPLSYEGVKATNPCQVIQALRAPLTSDTGYDIGTMWVNTSAATVYFLARLSGGTASWVNTASLLLAAASAAPAPVALSPISPIALAPVVPAPLPKLKAPEPLPKLAENPVEKVVKEIPKAALVSEKSGKTVLIAGRSSVMSKDVKANSSISLKRESNGSSNASQLGELKVGQIFPGHSFVINSFLPGKSGKLASADFSFVSWTIN